MTRCATSKFARSFFSRYASRFTSFCSGVALPLEVPVAFSRFSRSCNMTSVAGRGFRSPIRIMATAARVTCSSRAMSDWFSPRFLRRMAMS